MISRRHFWIAAAGLAVLITGWGLGNGFPAQDRRPTELQPVRFDYAKITGIGFEPGCTRRDPSDIIEVDGSFYVWYTKVFGRAEGYWGTIWYASSPDGLAWIERGEALGRGEAGAFDAQAVFTPNILSADGRFYLFYTGVKPTPDRQDGVFENNSTTDITAIGVADAESPDGPFRRTSPDPILTVSENPDAFDSYRVDDAALLYRDKRYWLYYKGRSLSHGAQGPSLTRMGVAFSDRPQGPYIKHGPPLLENSHEVLIWPHRRGVAALASKSRTLEYALDGLDFLSDPLAVPVAERPNAPGAFRPDLTAPSESDQGLEWGISMIHNGKESYLIRFECNLGVRRQ